MPAAKCRYCQTSLKIKEAYKVIIKNKSAYFCNQEHYSLYMEKLEEEQKQKQMKKELAEKRRQEELEEKQRQIEYNKQMKDKVYYLICEILGRKAIVNTALWKEKELWNRVCTDEVIAQYLEENKDYLTGAISRLDDVEFNRIRYLSAILKNKLGDYKPKKKEARIEMQKQEFVEMRDDFGIRTNNKKKITRRKGFSEMEG